MAVRSRPHAFNYVMGIASGYYIIETHVDGCALSTAFCVYVYAMHARPNLLPGRFIVVDTHATIRTC